MAREIILRLDYAQESRQLSLEEPALRKDMKCKCLGLASLARTIARQRARLMYLVEGDANTRFFHLQACHRSRKNHIASLKVHDSEIVLNEKMANAVFEHYNAIMGTPFQRTADIDLDALGLQLHDLTMLDVCFSEFEKTPGPDGFTGLFYKLAWPIIKADIINAFNAFWALDGRSFNLINEAFMVLLKKSEPVEIKDYRAISLIHSFGKLVTKCLSHRLALVLNELVHPSQSAFIQGRSIHDNFRAVHLTCKALQQSRRSHVLLKIDIAKAFDGHSSWRWCGALVSVGAGETGCRSSSERQAPRYC
jgi:hypothetical protein